MLPLLGLSVGAPKRHNTSGGKAKMTNDDPNCSLQPDDDSDIEEFEINEDGEVVTRTPTKEDAFLKRPPRSSNCPRPPKPESRKAARKSSGSFRQPDL